MNARAARILTVLCGMALAASLAVGQAVGAAAPAGHNGRLQGIVHGNEMIITPATGHIQPGEAFPPLAVKVRGRDTAGQPLTTAAGPAGYGATQIEDYLGLHGDGAGQTVAIVDAFDDPTIVSDVNTYSQQYGLPQVCGSSGAGSGCFHFTVTAPDGTSGTDSGWGLEMALDVEMVHAVAPEASVVLAEAFDSSLQHLLSAIDHAAALSPDVISNSWGLPNTEFTSETAFDYHCELAHSLCVFSSGDNSNPAGYPATSPYVLAVGGTSLSLAGDGTVTSETLWHCGCFEGSGGGLSYIEPRPGYQRAVNGSPYRGVPDVSFDADPATGVAVFDSDGVPGAWVQVGGTSVGAPAWSAILADGDQLLSLIHI